VAEQSEVGEVLPATKICETVRRDKNTSSHYPNREEVTIMTEKEQIITEQEKVAEMIRQYPELMKGASLGYLMAMQELSQKPA